MLKRGVEVTWPLQCSYASVPTSVLKRGVEVTWPLQCSYASIPTGVLKRGAEVMWPLQECNCGSEAEALETSAYKTAAELELLCTSSYSEHRSKHRHVCMLDTHTHTYTHTYTHTNTHT